MTTLAFIVTAIMLPLILSEFTDWAPKLATKIIGWAARHQGDLAAADRYSEEWLGELDTIPGRLSKLACALSKVVFLPSIRRTQTVALTRRSRSGKTGDDAELATSPVAEFLGSSGRGDAEAEAVRRAFLTLPERDQRLIAYAFSSGRRHDWDEIAEALGIRRRRVVAMRRRALIRLRKTLLADPAWNHVHE